MQRLAAYEQLQQVGRYVGFDEADAAILSELAPVVGPMVPSIAHHFYANLLDNPSLGALIEGEVQLARLRNTLLRWISALFTGPYDEAYAEAQARIGDTHVRVGVDERYMLAAMNLVREQLHDALEDAAMGASGTGPPLSHTRRRAGQRALDRICDMSLSVILGAYRRRYLENAVAEQRMAQIGRIVGDVGQALREPLSVIETSAAILELGCDELSSKRHLHRIASHVRSASSAIDGLLEVATSKPVERQVVSLHALISDVIASLPYSANIAPKVHAPAAELMLHVEPVSMRRMIAHLLAPAVEPLHVARDLPPELRVDTEGDVLRLIVSSRSSDSEEQTDFMPEPTLVEDERSFGLLLCRTIAEQHGGTLNVYLGASSRVVVEVRLPRAVRRAA